LDYGLYVCAINNNKINIMNRRETLKRVLELKGLMSPVSIQELVHLAGLTDDQINRDLQWLEQWEQDKKEWKQ
jgi:hypothetical protein